MLRVGVALAILLAVAGCSGSADETGAGTESSTSSGATEPASAAVQQTQMPAGVSFTTVRFENGEHLTGGAIDAELLEDKTRAAAIAASENWTNCLIHADACDFDRDVAPSVSGSHEQFIRNLFDSVVDSGQRYRPGPIDTEVVIESSSNATPPIVAEVRICVVDTGEMYIPGVDGDPDEIVNEDEAGFVYSYVVVVEDDGLLTVASRTAVPGQIGDTTFCDQYL